MVDEAGTGLVLLWELLSAKVLELAGVLWRDRKKVMGVIEKKNWNAANLFVRASSRS